MRVLLGIGLAGVHLVVLGSLAWQDVALALAVGLAAGRLFGHPWGHASPAVVLRRLPWVPWFALGVVGQLVSGGVRMLGVVLGLRSAEHVGEVRVPFGERSELAAHVAGLVATASPGTALIDADPEEEVLTLSSIDASDPESIREDLDRFHARFQRRIVP